LLIFSHLPGHNVFDFASLHATEDLKLFVLSLLPDARRYQHLRETVEVEAHASHVQLFVRVPVKAIEIVNAEMFLTYSFLWRVNLMPLGVWKVQ